MTPTEAVLGELQTIRERMRELVELQSGEFVAVPRRYIVNAVRPFHTFKVKGDRDFHSVQIDNQSAVDVELRRDGMQPTAGDSDARVPPRSGRVLTFPYGELSVGIDPAVVPAGDTILFVTFYSRALAPSSYPFAT